jgi:hypothetical protein
MPNDTDDPIISRQREEAEKHRQEQERRLDKEHDRDELCATFDRVASAGADYEFSQRADRKYLGKLVAALADVGAVLDRRGLLRLLDEPPAGLLPHGLDAFRKAKDVLDAARADPDRAKRLLSEWAGELPDFALSVAGWLRRGFASVVWEHLAAADAATDTGGTGQGPTAVSRLSARQRRILRYLRDQNATSERSALTRECVVKEGFHQRWEPANWKYDFSGLRKLDLTAHKTGPNGGIWLTPVGREVAARLPTE